MPEWSILLKFESEISLENFYLTALTWFSFLWPSDVKMKSKHTSMWIIHIKLKRFYWEENFLLAQVTREKRIYL